MIADVTPHHEDFIHSLAATQDSAVAFSILTLLVRCSMRFELKGPELSCLRRLGARDRLGALKLGFEPISGAVSSTVGRLSSSA